MKQIHPWVLRGLLLAMAAGMIPACTHDEDDDDDSRPPAQQNPPPNPPPPNPVVLMDERFEGAWPGSAWTVGANGPGPEAAVDGTQGNPAPSLRVTTTAGPDPLTASGPLFLVMDSTTTITGGPLTVSVDMMVPASGEGSGSIAILDGTNTPVAAAEWHPSDTVGAVTFMIADTVNPVPTTVGVPPPSPGPTFHKLTFSVDGTGQASWSLDGGAPAMSQSGFPAGPYTVRLYLMVESATGPFATFYYDNVLATTP